MHTKRIFLPGIFILTLLISCQSLKPTVHNFPEPENTESLAIDYQIKTSYRFDGVYVDNEFDGARMNGFRQINDTTFRVIISPENFPINESAYFSFRIRSERERDIDLEIEYTEHTHRYIPKLSYDGRNWTAMDSTQFDTLKAGNLCNLKLSLNQEKLYVSAQELLTSFDNREWVDSLKSEYPYIKNSVVGKSKLGRDILLLDINQGGKKDFAIAVFSRLHPPETTGYIAMKSFVETILEDMPLSNTFRKNYRILVYPMLNPDGVDLGHWRHNAGGIDLNRDWSNYRQEETHVVANHLVKTTKQSKNDLLLGIDFHSTQEDIYYTLTDKHRSSIFGFKDMWLQAIDESFSNYTPNDAPFDIGQAISKGWFFLEFGAEGITYEVGDETDRDFVKSKARVAAKEMMKLLVLK